MIKKKLIGVFCEIYGNTIENRILEYLLENSGLDFAIGDVARELSISRPKTYQVIKTFEKDKRVKKSRIVGKTQLYILNKSNLRVKLFLRNFKECLKIVAEEYTNKNINLTVVQSGVVSSKTVWYSFIFLLELLVYP